MARYKINGMVKNFLWTGNTSMPWKHVRQLPELGKSGFTYSACGQFTKNKKIV